MDDKREPIALARERYQMRKKRPTRELVHDEVEDALTQEFHDLQVIVSNLEQKMKQVDREIAGLLTTLQQLEANITDKNSALGLDMKCIEMRAAGSVASTNASRASSSMLALQQKIDNMESQLVDARKSRMMMEQQLGQLKSQV